MESQTVTTWPKPSDDWFKKNDPDSVGNIVIGLRIDLEEYIELRNKMKSLGLYGQAVQGDSFKMKALGWQIRDLEATSDLSGLLNRAKQPYWQTEALTAIFYFANNPKFERESLSGVEVKHSETGETLPYLPCKPKSCAPILLTDVWLCVHTDIVTGGFLSCSVIELVPISKLQSVGKENLVGKYTNFTKFMDFLTDNVPEVKSGTLEVYILSPLLAYFVKITNGDDFGDSIDEAVTMRNNIVHVIMIPSGDKAGNASTKATALQAATNDKTGVDPRNGTAKPEKSIPASQRKRALGAGEQESPTPRTAKKAKPVATLMDLSKTG